jgi:hypothetical protein
MGFGRRAKRPGRQPSQGSATGDRWLSRQVRGLRPDRNPLRRRIDRAETYLLGGLFLASAASLPFAVHAASHAAYENAFRTQQQQAATRHQVEAKITAIDTGAVSGYYNASGAVTATATWTSVTGVHRSGVILVQLGTRKGTEFLVWTDQAGNLTTQPLATAQVISERDAATIGAIGGIVVMTVGAGGIIHFVLYRRRLAAWAADWRVTAQAWNRQSW